MSNHLQSPLLEVELLWLARMLPIAFTQERHSLHDLLLISVKKALQGLYFGL